MMSKTVDQVEQSIWPVAPAEIAADQVDGAGRCSYATPRTKWLPSSCEASLHR